MTAPLSMKSLEFVPSSIRPSIVDPPPVRYHAAQHPAVHWQSSTTVTAPSHWHWNEKLEGLPERQPHCISGVRSLRQSSQRVIFVLASLWLNTGSRLFQQIFLLYKTSVHCTHTSPRFALEARRSSALPSFEEGLRKGMRDGDMLPRSPPRQLDTARGSAGAVASSSTPAAPSEEERRRGSGGSQSTTRGAAGGPAAACTPSTTPLGGSVGGKTPTPTPTATAGAADVAA